MACDSNEKLNLVNLPELVLEAIFSNLTFDEIARNRIVCKQFDRIGKRLLNRGFNSIKKYHDQCRSSVTSQMPRRDSERRVHPLFECWLSLWEINNIIYMLKCTFFQYIDLNLCCFIPGKVIDELFRVTRLVTNSKEFQPKHDVLEELYDITIMAVEYFNEKISPNLEHSIVRNKNDNKLTLLLPDGFNANKLNQHLKRIYSLPRKSKTQVVSAKGLVKLMKRRMEKQGLLMHLQSVELKKQAKKISEQDTQIAKLKKHFKKCDQQNGDPSVEREKPRILFQTGKFLGIIFIILFMKKLF